MTADFGRFVFYFSLWLCALSLYGECRTDLHDGGYQLLKNDDDSKLTKPTAAGAVLLANNTLDEAIASVAPAATPATTPKEHDSRARNSPNNVDGDADRTNFNPDTVTRGQKIDQPSAVRTGHSVSVKRSRVSHSSSADNADDGSTLDDDVVQSKSSVNSKPSKVRDLEPTTLLVAKDDATKARGQWPQQRSADDAGGVPSSTTGAAAATSRQDRPPSIMSRGRQKFQLDNAIAENTRPKATPLHASVVGSAGHLRPAVVELTQKLPNGSAVGDAGGRDRAEPHSTFTSSSVAAQTATTASTTTDHERRRGNENATRSPKSSSFRYQHVGSDGYVFENHYDTDADTEKYKEVGGGDDFQYDSRESVHSMGDPENNIDRIRNFNENAGAVKVGNIVKKPHGFTLTTESHTDAETTPKTVTSRVGSVSGVNPVGGGPGTRKKITGGNTVGEYTPAAVVGSTRPGKGSSTENSPTSISKNEILRKPLVKPISNFTTRRRVSPPGVSNENSLPTTSAVWALAALKTTTTAKLQKRPNIEGSAPPKPSLLPSTNVKPIVSWSTRLQKTTTEDPLDATTTLRATLEVDAETMSPFALSGVKLMNMSNVVESVSVVSTETNLGSVFNQSNGLVNQSLLSNSNQPTGSVREVTFTSTSTPATSAITVEDIPVDLVDSRKGNEEDQQILDTGKYVAVKDSVDDFVKFNYTTDGSQSADVNETRVAILNDERDTAGDNENEIRFKNVSNEAKVDHSSKSPSTAAEEANINVSVSANKGVVEIVDVTVSHSTTKLAAGSSTPLNGVGVTRVVDDSWSVEEQPSSSSRATPFVGVNENTESNVIVDRYNNERDKKNEVRVDSNHVESTNFTNSNSEHEFVSPNVTVVKTLSPSGGTSPLHKNVSSAVVAEEHVEVDAITETSPPYELGLDDSNDSEMPAVINDTHVSSPELKEHTTTEMKTPERADFLSNTTHNISSSTALPTTVKLVVAESVSDSVTSTVRNFHSKSYPTSPSMSVVSTTTKMTATTPSTTTSITARPPVHVTSADEEDMSTDLLTTSIPVSSTTTTTIVKAVAGSTTPANRKHDESTTVADEVVYLTTMSNIQKVLFTTSTTDSAALSSTSPKVSTSTTTTTTTPAPVTAQEIPVVPPFKPKLPPENVPGYLMLFFKSSFADICQTSSTLRENLFQFITQRSLRVQSKDQVVMVIDPEQCKEPDHSLRLIPVALYLVDDFGSYDKTLIDEMKKLLEDDNSNNYTLPIHEIVYHENIIPDNSRVVAAMIITSIAAVCFVLLIFLMCTIRNRQKLNYGQRCTPVSVDDYNLDNISDYNSMRRKGIMRASKRSYGNPAFDDPMGPSKSLTYNGLLKACENRCALDEEFTQISTVTVKPDELPLGAEMKNRYANVIPLPETRVSLSSNNNCSDSIHDYINANYVKGFKDADKFYVACQAPLQNTIEDFWKMVWKEQTKVIIMLTGLSENGVEKCADYLPPSEVLDCHRLFGDYQVTLKKREVKEKYVISCLQLKNMENNLWREVTHLWYTNWPAQGVPNEQSSIIALLIEARAYMRNTTGPHVVHCSPGTGRTGTVIGIDICIRDYELSRSVNIPVTVAKLRRCRAGAVQTKEQYAFIYKVLALYARKLNGGAPLDSI